MGPQHLGSYHVVVLLGEQQDPAHVRLVVVERVQFGRGHMEGAVLREAVVQGVVEGQQVHVVHGKVVSVVAALQETHVDQGRSVEPGQCTFGYRNIFRH